MAELSGRQHQLALEVRLRDDATVDNFLALPKVQPILLTLEQQLSDEGEPIIFLHGVPGSGKSHLLQAACHLAGAAALYLPLEELAEHPPQEVLQGVETLNLVCLDDVGSVLGSHDWELALFDLCNRARQSGCRLLLSAEGAPRTLGVKLPDLGSRLSWGIVYQLPQLDDECRAVILQFRAGRRGLSISKDVADYIVNRAPRSLSSLLEVLDHLDRVSLAEQRALSIPFIKQSLGW